MKKKMNKFIAVTLVSAWLLTGCFKRSHDVNPPGYNAEDCVYVLITEDPKVGSWLHLCRKDD